jgi:hypothetical protein
VAVVVVSVAREREGVGDVKQRYGSGTGER